MEKRNALLEEGSVLSEFWGERMEDVGTRLGNAIPMRKRPDDLGLKYCINRRRSGSLTSGRYAY